MVGGRNPTDCDTSLGDPAYGGVPASVAEAASPPDAAFRGHLDGGRLR